MRFVSTCALAALLLAPGAATAACSASGSSVLVDDFQDDLGGWDLSDGSLSFGSGGTVTIRKGRRSNVLLNQNFGTKEGHICVTIAVPPTAEEGVVQGLVFWARSYRDYYMVLGSLKKKVTIYKYTEGTYLSLYEIDAPALNTAPDATNDFAVTLKGNLVTVSLNGTEIRKFRAQPPEAGLSRFGFYVEAPKVVTEEEGVRMTIKQVVLNRS